MDCWSHSSRDYIYIYRYRYRYVAWIPKCLETHNSAQIYSNCLYYLSVCVCVCTFTAWSHNLYKPSKGMVMEIAKPISNEMTWGTSVSFSLIAFAALEVWLMLETSRPLFLLFIKLTWEMKSSELLHVLLHRLYQSRKHLHSICDIRKFILLS